MSQSEYKLQVLEDGTGQLVHPDGKVEPLSEKMVEWWVSALEEIRRYGKPPKGVV